MQGRVESGQLVTLEPPTHPVKKGCVVLCKVGGAQYLHLVVAVGADGRYQIGNNKGRINGWCTPSQVYGILIKVEN